jgi:hypothetical protein
VGDDGEEVAGEEVNGELVPFLSVAGPRVRGSVWAVLGLP